jgi:hypothetical protein
MLSTKDIPSDAVEVIITGKDDTAAGTERDGGDTGNQVVAGIDSELLIATKIEKTSSGIIRTGDEGISAGEKLNSVDVAVMAGEGVSALVCSHIPDFSRGIARTGNKDVLIRIQGERHDITFVALKDTDLAVGFDIPQYTSLITGRSDDLFVADESAAR